MLVALSYTLSWIKPFRLPQGGSVSLEMLPLFLLSFRRGLRIGVIGGVVLGLLKLTISPQVVHPAQLLLDYPVAFGAIGISGVFKVKDRSIKDSMSHSRSLYILWMACGIILGSTCRFIFHLISGVIFFSQTVGIKAWLASAIYNSAYMIPSAILCLIFIPVIVRFLPATRI